MAYGHTFPSGAGNAAGGAWSETRPHHFLNTDRATVGEMSDGVREQVTKTLWESSSRGMLQGPRMNI
jgi:hypothetical protein